MTRQFWGKDREAELQACLDEGLTFSAAAERMGTTKNACIGFSYRQRMSVMALTTLERLDALNIFPAAGHCVFPVGNPGDPSFHFCGDKVARDGCSYCVTHAAKCFSNISKLTVREAA